MILEGIVTSELEDGSMHVAPMGPWVNSSLTEWVLKPFQTSTTFRNLHRTHRCVFHVIDDALLLANAVLGKANHSPSSFQQEIGFTLNDSCHWYALQLTDWDVSQPRAQCKGRVVDQGMQKPFFGWNRAKHAVLEAAILASRLQILSRSEIQTELDRLQLWIDKTAGDRELEAFALLNDFMNHHWSKSSE